MQPLHTMPGIGHSTQTMADFKGTLGDTLWREGGVRCVLVPAGIGLAVELRSERGGVFLRKPAPGITAARNEAEYLRLLLQHESTPRRRRRSSRLP